jgi:hypothetical protein
MVEAALALSMAGREGKKKGANGKRRLEDVEIGFG